jgi:hypothetical protein
MDPKNNKYKLYHFINQHGGFINFDIIEIRKYPCVNNNEARAKQCKYIQLLNADLNSNHVINKTNNVKAFWNENKHILINIERAKKANQNNDIKRQKNNNNWLIKIRKLNYIMNSSRKLKKKRKKLTDKFFFNRK